MKKPSAEVDLDAGLMELLKPEKDDTMALYDEIAMGISSPAKKLVDLVFMHALKDRASDIQFEDFGDRGVRIRYTMDGILYEMIPPPEHLFQN